MNRILAVLAAVTLFGSAAHAACTADIHHCPADTSWDGTTDYNDDYNGAGGSESACAARPQVWRNNCGVGTSVTEHYSQDFAYPVAGSDTTAPTNPSSFTATANSSSQITLTWAASTDNVGVVNYNVYRGGNLLVTLGNVLTYVDNSNLAAATSYTYNVSAVDAAGNESQWWVVSATATTQTASNGGGGGTPATLAQTTAWITAAFAGVTQYTGTVTGRYNVIYPGIVHDGVCTGGYYCYEVSDHDLSLYPPYPPPSTDVRFAFVNTTVSNQIVDGQFAAGILTDGGTTWNTTLDLYLANVSITPNFPVWQNYQTTNFDGMTMDGGFGQGHVYASDVTINGWDDAAFDVKPGFLQCVRCNVTGSGFNTFKFWNPGPHYIVDSTIVNTRYDANTAENRDDGGIIWTWFCGQLVLNVYNSTFNGSSTIPSKWISCTDRTGGAPTINYLTTDPRTTGEMSPMFTAH
jgi:chitodextrinase